MLKNNPRPLIDEVLMTTTMMMVMAMKMTMVLILMKGDSSATATPGQRKPIFLFAAILRHFFRVISLRDPFNF